MAVGTYWSGRASPVKFKYGSNSEQTLNVVDHTWRESIDKIDITHTGHSGIQALIGSIVRGTGNVKAFLDTTTHVCYWDSGYANIRAGVQGQLKHYLTTTILFTIGVLITEVNSMVPVAGGVSYDFTVELNAEANTDGSTAIGYTFPTAT